MNQPPSAFTWLHLTDLHCGLKEAPHAWPNVRDVITADLRKLARIGHIDAVFFTGDLVQSGIEFDHLETILGELWAAFSELGMNPVLLAVPGNHDLVRPRATRPAAWLRQLAREGGFSEVEEEFWEDPSSEYRAQVRATFDNYCKWWTTTKFRKDVKITDGLLPGDFSATLSGSNSLKIGVAGLNTAFLQLDGSDYRHRLALHERQLHAVCDNDPPAWCLDHDITFLLTHHGPEWLDPSSRDRLHQEINPAGRFSLHLFGHAHLARTSASSLGSGPLRHTWQGWSLFGLEKVGNPPTSQRVHGYSVGQIVLGNGSALRQWPRIGKRDTNGWRVVPDSDNHVIDESDGGTPLISLATTRTNRRPARPTRTRTRDPGAVDAGKVDDRTFEQELGEYRRAIVQNYGRMTFVEIPSSQDIPSLDLDSLYVEPLFSTSEANSDLPTLRWPPRIDTRTLLAGNRDVVLLGDPGSGKSTLVSFVSWQLCRNPLVRAPWCLELSHCIPFPMILRELQIKADVTWESLLDSYLQHSVGKLLRTRANIERILRAGRGIIMLDGIDEVGNIAVRGRLRDAVHHGMSVFGDSRWVLTSRVVGYHQVPFHIRTGQIGTDTHKEVRVTRREVSKSRRDTPTPVASVYYLSPFDKNQIKKFSDNWYAQHTNSNDAGGTNSKTFISAIEENEGTRRLARVPYLLTLMALIHHKNASLPHGRTELYERIASAYLDSIDQRRKLDRLPFSLTQKKQWLSEVAYQMQLKRASVDSARHRSQIFASAKEVTGWLRSAMTEGGIAAANRESKALLEYFSARSGLLLPRGDNKFCFMHLSLQEYFSACFLEPRLGVSRFSSTVKKHTPTDKQLRAWAGQENWRETFVFLFEALSDKSPAAAEGFLNHILDGRLASDRTGRQAAAADLLATVAVNPFVKLSAKTKAQALKACWGWVLGLKLGKSSHFFPGGKVTHALVREAHGDLAGAWKRLGVGRELLRDAQAFDFTGCSDLRDIGPLRRMRNLVHLDLENCSMLESLTAIAGLTSLRLLNIEGCHQLRDLESVAPALHVETLIIGRTAHIPLFSNLASLRTLHIHDSENGAIDLTPVAHLRALEIVCTGDSEEVTVSVEAVSPGVRLALAEASSQSEWRAERRAMLASVQTDIP